MSMRDEPLDRRRERFLRDFFENSELYTFGIITQKGYKDLEDRLTAHAAEVQRRFHRWFIITLSAFAIIALSSTVGLIGFGVVLGKQGKTTDEIQQQRRDFVRGSCTDQNRRHDDTSRRLLRAMRVAIRRNPERREQIRQSSEVSLGLIDSLVPKQNCVQVVREATH
jgi:hypothetical protein